MFDTCGSELSIFDLSGAGSTAQWMQQSYAYFLTSDMVEYKITSSVMYLL